MALPTRVQRRQPRRPGERPARQHRSRARRRQLGASRPGDRDRGARSIPADGTFAVAVGAPQKGWSVLHRAVRSRLHAVLPPAPPRRSRTRPGSSASPATGARIPARGRLGGRSNGALDPEARAVTVRALVGLAALNVAYAVVGPLAPVGRFAPSVAGAACCGSPGSATCSVSPHSGSSGRRSSSSASRSAAGSVLASLVAAAGVCGAVGSVGAALPRGLAGLPTGSIPLVRHRRRHRTRRASSSRRCSARRGSEPAGVRRLGVLGAEGARRSTSSDGLDEHVFTTSAEPDLSAARPDPRRGGLSRDGGRRRRHVPPAVLVPRRGRRRRDRRVPPPARASLGSLAVAPARPRRPALRRAAPDAAGRHARSTCSSWSARCCSRSGSATGRVAPRVRSQPCFAGAAMTKREGLLYSALALGVTFGASWPRQVASGWPRLALVAGDRRRGRNPVAALVSRARHHGARRHRRLGASASLHRALDSLRLSFDVLFDVSLWSVVPFVR